MRSAAERQLQQLTAATGGGADLDAAAERCKQLGCSADGVASVLEQFAARQRSSCEAMASAADSGTLSGYRAARAAALEAGCTTQAADCDAIIQKRVVTLHSELQRLLQLVLQEPQRAKEAVERLGGSRSYLMHLETQGDAGNQLAAAIHAQNATAAALACCATAVAAADAQPHQRQQSDDAATSDQQQHEVQPLSQEPVPSQSSTGAEAVAASTSAVIAGAKALGTELAKLPKTSSCTTAECLGELCGVLAQCARVGLAQQALVALQSVALLSGVSQVRRSARSPCPLFLVC